VKACVCDRYGGPERVSVRDVPMPVPRPNEVLVRIIASTVSAADGRVRALRVPRGMAGMARLALGLRGPRRRVLGTELAGVVVAIGARVTRFAVGDRVLGFPGADFGCHAEYRAMADGDELVTMPPGLSFEEAASLPFGAMSALHFLRAAHVRPGERMLVVGASGAVGSALVQLGQVFGAEVAGVTSTANLDLVAGLGAGRVIDYTATDILQGGERFDIVADLVGAVGFARYRHVLRPRGRMLAVAAEMPDMLAMAWAPFWGMRVFAGPATTRPGDLAQVAAWAAQGVLRPVIDRCYAMEEIAAAHAYVDTGRKRGSVVVRIAGAD
jgi:NADPH:quinone reductase-like Zn-dependent oxidoreductase